MPPWEHLPTCPAHQQELHSGRAPSLRMPCTGAHTLCAVLCWGSCTATAPVAMRARSHSHPNGVHPQSCNPSPLRISVGHSCWRQPTRGLGVITNQCACVRLRKACTCLPRAPCNAPSRCMGRGGALQGAHGRRGVPQQKGASWLPSCKRLQPACTLHDECAARMCVVCEWRSLRIGMPCARLSSIRECATPGAHHVSNT